MENQHYVDYLFHACGYGALMCWGVWGGVKFAMLMKLNGCHIKVFAIIILLTWRFGSYECVC